MPNRLDKTAADYIAIAVGPALIMAMVGSLVYFLLDVFYQGDYDERLRWIMACFVFAAVLIGRISIESGTARAAMFAFALALVMALAISMLVEHRGPLAPFGWYLDLALLALIWWCTHKLTWDCTFVDEQQLDTGEGLLQTIGLDDEAKDAATPPEVAERIAAQKRAEEMRRLQGTTGDGDEEQPQRAWERWFTGDKRPHAPGVWVVYFSLAALPIFGVGQLFIPATNEERRQDAFRLLAIYVASGLGLLLTTSFLGMRRYLRQRSVEMPPRVAGKWIALGAGLGLGLFVLAVLLPRPNAEYAVSSLTGTIGSPQRQASRYAPPGGEGASDPGKQSRSTTSKGKGTRKKGSGSATKSDGAGSSSGSKTGDGGTGSKQAGGDSGSKTGGGESGQKTESSPTTPDNGGPKTPPGGEGTKSPSGSDGTKTTGGSDSGKTSGSTDMKSPGEKSPGGKSPDSDGTKTPSSSGAKSGTSKSDTAKSGATKSESASSSGGEQPKQAEKTDGSEEGDQGDEKEGDDGKSESQSAGSSGSRSGSSSGFRPFDSLHSAVSWLPTMLKWAFHGVIIAVVAFFAWRHRRELWAALVGLWTDLRNLLASLFGGKKKERPTAEQSPPTPSAPKGHPFADYPNPFTSGLAGRLTADQLVAYTFEALEAWAREHGCPRGADKTPLEFATELGAASAPLAAPLRLLALLYYQMAYAPGSLRAERTEELEYLWRLMDRASSQVRRTG